MTHKNKLTGKEIEVITFDEFIEYGRLNCNNIVFDYPWHFTYKDCIVTHEHNEHYLLSNDAGEADFYSHDMLITEAGKSHPCRTNVFKQFYEKI